MNENNESIKIFRCNICNKKYSSQSSLCNHNKKFHGKLILNASIIPQESSKLPQESSKLPQELIENNLICIYCNKHYSRLDNIKRHYNTCKKNINNDKHKNKTEIIENKSEIIEIKNMLKELLEKNCKIHPKTLQKINKQLINNNTNTTNNGTINNAPVINNTYVKFGNEQLSSLLTRKDMLNIINKQCLCIEESIKTVHFNLYV